MLQAIRDKVTGWIAYGIIFLISIPFALWGVNSYLGGGEVPPAATVNGEEISLRILDQAYANYRQRLLQLFGGSIPESFGGEAVLRQQVLGDLIEEFALRQYTDQQGYRIGDADLNRMIRGMQVFQRDGNFDAELYQAQLRSQGYSALGFEQELRRSQQMEQFQLGIRATAFAVPVREQEYARLTNQNRKIRSVRFSAASGTVEISAEDIEQRYLAQTDRYRTPERIRIDYIEVSLDGVKQNIDVDADTVRARYEDNIAAYSAPEIREASHILLQAEDADSDEVLARIQGIRERIVNGESFADLARELSEDPGSAPDGGNLGEIERGLMVQPFESALYALEVGQLSEPVRTSFGWHLIQLHGVSGGEVQSFDALRADLEDEIKTEQAESQIYDLVENLSNLAYEQADSLQPAAEQLDLELRTSDWFDRGSGDGIASDSRIRQAAFAPDVLQQGLNSEAIDLGGERIVFLRLNDRQESAQQPLEAVEARIRSELLNMRRREASLQTGIAAVDELNSGLSMEDLATRWQSSVIDHGFVNRQTAGLDASLVNKAFTMTRPDSSPVYDGVTLADGDYVVIELIEVTSGGNATDQEQNQILLGAIANAEYQSALQLVANRAEVVRTPLEDLNYTEPNY